MDKSLFQSLSGFVKLILDLLITFVVFSLSFIILLVLGKVIFNIPIKELVFSAAFLDNPNALKYLVVIQSLSLFWIPSFVIAWLYSRPGQFFNLSYRVNYQSIILIIALIIVSQGVVNILAYWNYNFHLTGNLHDLELKLREMEKTAQVLTNKMLSDTSFSGLVLNIIVVALIPAIGEELFFRGVLQSHLHETIRNKHIAIFIAAFIFAFAHNEFFTFLPRIFLGLILGYIFYWFKNIWAPILAHFTNNFLGVLIYFFSLRQGKSLEELSQVTKPQIWIVLLSLVLLIPIMYKLKQLSNDKS